MRIGFVQAMYNASEGDTYAMVCVEVKEGSLSIPLNFSLSSYNQTAGIYVVIYTCTIQFE